MDEGRIQAVFEDGLFVLKLSGDVRLTLCATLDQQVQRVAAVEGLESVIIDLREATNVDSTALGFLAKLALAVRDRLVMPAQVVAAHPDVLTMLKVMGFDEVASVVDAGSLPEADQADLDGASCCNAPALNASQDDADASPQQEQELRGRILEAHRLLMCLNGHNRLEFQPLIELLESEEHRQPH
ncbi:STAS domain-containing protein [Cobetia amphilecti]|uniref:STAS domain-containing protein n=1 Tax=Cobetia TaxID=204286 RepID=UPI002941F277|nr:STAS domain-containing protein [Cobetia amphilecti]WOI26622.1 STAS domain-containing protein [Cobetia amphilecti]